MENSIDGQTEYQLNNGVCVVHDKIPCTGIVSVQVWIKAGSSYESSSDNGISHFLEHILFKGTKKFKPNEIDAVVENCGGIMNAGTSKDYTTYYITLASEHAETAFDVLSEMVFNASFLPDEIEKEKPVVLQEIARKFDDPTYAMWADCLKDLFYPSPYHMEIIGTTDNVSSFTPEDLYKYYKTHYHPDNMTLVVVGDIEHSEVERLADQYFSEAAHINAAAVLPAEQPSVKEASFTVYEKDVFQDYVAVACQLKATVKNSPVYEIISEVLSGGEYSILNEIMKNGKQLVTAVSASELLYRTAGAYVFYLVTNPGGAEAASKELRNILNNLAEKGFTGWQIEKAKNRLKSRILFMKEKAASEASEIGFYYTVGMKNFFHMYTKIVDNISVDEINGVLSTLSKAPHLEYRTVPKASS